MQINPEPDILGLIDVQPTFMPGGELPVADGDSIDSGRQQAACVVSITLSRPRTGTRRTMPPSPAPIPAGKPYDTIEMPYGEQVLWPDHGIAGTPIAAIHPAIDQTRIEVIIRKGFRPDTGQLFGVFRERPADTDRAGGLAASARLLPAVPVRPRHRFLRRLVSRGRRCAWFHRVHHPGRLPRHRPSDSQDGRHHDGCRTRQIDRAGRAVHRQRARI